jgi:hypothetical protein
LYNPPDIDIDIEPVDVFRRQHTRLNDSVQKEFEVEEGYIKEDYIEFYKPVNSVFTLYAPPDAISTMRIMSQP